MAVVSASIAESQVNLITGATVWVGFFSANPGVSGSNAVSTLPRQEMSSTDWAAFTTDPSTGGRRRLSNKVLEFGSPTGEVTIAWVGFWSAETGGNFLAAGQMPTPRTVSADDAVRIPSGQLEVVGAGQGQSA